jgi:hypothetical protein
MTTLQIDDRAGRELVAAVLVLREVMHHLGFEELALAPA